MCCGERSAEVYFHLDVEGACVGKPSLARLCRLLQPCMVERNVLQAIWQCGFWESLVTTPKGLLAVGNTGLLHLHLLMGGLNCCQAISDPFLGQLSETELSVSVGTFPLSPLVALWHSWSTAVTAFTITLGGRTRKPLPCVFLLCAFGSEAY